MIQNDDNQKKDDKKRITNEEAFRAAVSGDLEAVNIIVSNFNNFVKKHAGIFMAINDNIGLEFNDLEIIGQKAVHQALQTYRGDYTPFVAYTMIVIKHAMWNLIKQHLSPTNQMINQSISLDSNLHGDDDTMMLSDAIGDTDSYHSPDRFDNEMIDYIDEMLMLDYSKDELAVIKHKLAGYKYEEIKKMLGIPKRQLDRTIANIKARYPKL